MRTDGRRRRTAFAAAAGLAAALLASAPAAPAAGLLIADGGLGGVLEIEEHAARVTVNNGIAVTEVTQVFRNTEDRAVEALYVFPVPKGASVANFSMWINGKEMVGEVVEKRRARQIYESYKPARRDPGLLEQKDFKTFEMRIFPVGPGARQRVQIAYYQELDVDHDWATYVYPLATSARREAASRTRGTFSLSLEVKSEVPIAVLESPSHGDRFVVAKHDPAYVQASLETTGGDLGRDVVLAFRLARPRTGLDLIASKAPGEDGFFCLTMTAGEELAPREAGMDYVFVLDVSGSMEQDGKLGLSRGSLDAFIRELGAEDRFELLAFNLQPVPLFRGLRTAGEETKRQGADFLAVQRARGGTSLRPAFAAAYRYAEPERPLNVVLLSDGLTGAGERAALVELIRSRPAGVRVFCIGVGNDVNRPLLQQLAEEAGGLAAFLSRGDNLGRQAKAFRRKLLRPAATGLTIDFGGADVYDVEPEKLPNLYHGAPVRLYGRYRRGGTATIRVRADVAGEPLDQTVEAALPEREGGNPEIERMWAWHRVGRLQKEADAAGAPDRAREEIVRLGEGFSIVTRHTSFLVLENDAEYKRWKIERRNALRLRRDRASQQELAARLESIRKRAEAALGPVEEAPRAPATASARPTSSPASPAPAPARPSSRGWDLDFGRSGGGGGGGGAIDPVTGGLALGLAAAAVAARRRGKRKERDDK
jgi:Ca-activated chloride channel family protein